MSCGPVRAGVAVNSLGVEFWNGTWLRVGLCACEVWMWVSTTSTYVSVRPVAAFDDAETGVEIFVVVDTNQHTCCAPRKSVQANVGRTKEETCASVWV